MKTVVVVEVVVGTQIRPFLKLFAFKYCHRTKGANLFWRTIDSCFNGENRTSDI